MKLEEKSSFIIAPLIKAHEPQSINGAQHILLCTPLSFQIRYSNFPGRITYSTVAYPNHVWHSHWNLTPQTRTGADSIHILTQATKSTQTPFIITDSAESRRGTLSAGTQATFYRPLSKQDTASAVSQPRG